MFSTVLQPIISFAILTCMTVTDYNKPKAFICTGSMSTKYHLKANCKGLERCTAKIKQVTIEKAKESGYNKLCGFED